MVKKQTKVSKKTALKKAAQKTGARGRGAHNVHGALTEAKVVRARNLARTGLLSQSEIARALQVHPVALHLSLTGKTWAWVKDPKPLKVGSR